MKDKEDLKYIEKGLLVCNDDVNETLEEDIEKHETLNPKLWNEDNALKPEVREKILQIVKEFTDELEEDGIKFKLDDVRLVGSNCSYNYNDKSDLDIHLVMNTKSLKCPDNLYPLLYSAYRSLFNKKFDIDFYGIPVEIYVETSDTEQLNDVEEGYKWRPSKTARREFAQKMGDIDEFCKKNSISQSSSGDSYYFTIDGQSYRVSNHSVEASNRNSGGKYHNDGRRDDTIYINAGKTRIIDIYNNLKDGKKLDGNGNVKN